MQGKQIILGRRQVKQRNFTKNASDIIPEQQLQKNIHAFLISNPYRCLSVNGKDICILNPGTINRHEGPDFHNMAVLINGALHIGNGEFHRKASDWFAHQHHHDKRYADVLLHLVFHYDIKCNVSVETIVLDQQIIPQAILPHVVNSLHSLDDLQDYALGRLLRKRDEIRDLWKTVHDPLQILTLYGILFLERRNRLRLRYQSKWSYEQIVQAFIYSQFIQQCLKGSRIPFDISIVKAVQRGGIPKHIFMEMFVNCIAPYIIQFDIGDQHDFISWYWSQPSFTFYYSLSHAFPDIPQLLMWQQQGVLEWKKQQYEGGRLSKEIGYPYDVILLQDQ
jgi:hypothetical protein